MKRIFFALACLIHICAWSQAQQEVYVKIKTQQINHSQSSAARQVSPLQALKAAPIMSEPSPFLDGLYKVEVPLGVNLKTWIDSVRHLPEVAYVEPMPQEHPLYTPNDPAIAEGNQNYLSVIKALSAWDISRSHSSIVIGVVDYGLSLEHEDLKDKLYFNEKDPINGLDDDGNGYVDDYLGYDFADGDNDAHGTNYHGARVGGIAGAAVDNDTGIAGVGFHARISPLKIFRSEDNQSRNAYEAILYAANNNYDVVVLSWGSVDTYRQAAQDIINYAVLERNLVVVAAAGNTPAELQFYPASYDNVLSVAATNLNDTKTSFSTFSYHVDMTAPGNAIYSTSGENGYAQDNGTSYSAPMVAGAAALLKSHRPDLSATQIMERIRSTSDDVYSKGNNSDFLGRLGKGRLNAYRALTEDDAKSIRMTGMDIQSRHAPIYYPGDTLTLNLTFRNHLTALPDLGVSLSAQSSNIDFLDQNVTMALITDETRNVSFRALLSDDTPANTRMLIRIDYQAAGYEDFQYFEFHTAPDRFDLDNQTISLTLDSKGHIGHLEDHLQGGLGIQWMGSLLTGHTAIAISHEGQAASNLPIGPLSGERHKELTTVSPIRPAVNEHFDMGASWAFSHESSTLPRLTVAARAMTNTHADYVIAEYRLTNQTADTLSELSLGFYADWQLGDGQNAAIYIDSLNALVVSQAGTSLYTAIIPLSEGESSHQALNLEATSEEEADVPDTYSEAFIASLSRANLGQEAGTDAPGNIATYTSVTANQIPPNQSWRYAFGIAVGTAAEELADAISQARKKYTQLTEAPTLLATVPVCKEDSTTIMLIDGKTYHYYADSRLSQYLGDDPFIINPPPADTTLYVSNASKGYELPPMRIDIDLMDDFAKFTISQDTLYLDSAINQVQFIDLSANPKRWSWDFGNQNGSTLRDPTVRFEEPGLYYIRLMVENELGCFDTTSRNLLVVERLPIPEVADFRLCPGEVALIRALNTDSLAVYAGAQARLIATGKEVQVTNLTRDTSLYVSNVGNGHESLKKRVFISVEEAPIIEYYPDSSSLSPGILLYAPSPATTYRWSAGSEFLGTSNPLPLLIDQEPLEVSLSVISETGCTGESSLTIHPKVSPAPKVVHDGFCPGATAVAYSLNEGIYGWYADGEGNIRIHKGKVLVMEHISRDTVLYVSNLDSLLPSDLIPVRLSAHDTSAIIHLSMDTLDLSSQHTVMLSAVPDDLSDHRWSVNESFVDADSSPLIYFPSSGTFQIGLTAMTRDGCPISISQRLTVIEALSLDTNDSPNNIMLYPNPAHGTVYLRGKEVVEQAWAIDNSGKKYILPVKENQIQIQNLHPGVYLLYLQNKTGVTTKKIVIDR